MRNENRKKEKKKKGKAEDRGGNFHANMLYLSKYGNLRLFHMDFIQHSLLKVP